MYNFIYYRHLHQKNHTWRRNCEHSTFMLFTDHCFITVQAKVVFLCTSLSSNVMCCAMWNHLHTFKKVRNTFMFFTPYKWYQIAQCISPNVSTTRKKFQPFWLIHIYYLKPIFIEWTFYYFAINKRVSTYVCNDVTAQFTSFLIMTL